MGHGGTRRAACSEALPASDLRAGTAAQLLPVTSVDLPAQRRTARRSQVSIFVRGKKKKKIDTDAPQRIVLGCRIDRSAL